MGKMIFDTKQPMMSEAIGTGRILLLTNEEEVKATDHVQTGIDTYEDKDVTRYQYDGVWLEKPEGTKTRDALIDIIVRLRYSLSEEMSLNRHKNNGDASYDAEWEEYNKYCEECKKIVDEYLTEKKKGLIR